MTTFAHMKKESRATARVSMKHTLYKALLRYAKKERSSVSRIIRISVEEKLIKEKIYETDGN